MAANDPINAIEELNREYLQFSAHPEKYIPACSLAKKLYALKSNFPHLIKWLKKRREYFAIKEKSDAISNYVPENKVWYYSAPPVLDKRGVVYSCITGKYDSPYEPMLISDNISYVLFTDDYISGNNYTGVWLKKQVENLDIKGTGNQTNRYYKFHPHLFFNRDDYDYSIYIDGNVQIISDITSLYNAARDSKIGIAMHQHFARDCAYLDALWCEYNKRGNLEAIKAQLHKYREEKFPEHFGLCEATIIVVDLHNETAEKIMDAWWDEFLRSGTGRDQMIFPYILWKHECTMADVGCLGNDEYQNPKFRINAHKGVLF